MFGGRHRQDACAALAFLLIGAAALSSVAGDHPWTPLFDGCTLNGWQGHRGETTHWIARDGVLAWTGGDGARLLATEKVFSDFELHLEFKYAPGTNSGVFFRTPLTSGRPAFDGNEFQIVDEAAPEFAEKMTDDRRMGALYAVQPPAPSVEAPPGKWHRLRIRCEGSRLLVRLNGQTILETDLSSYPASIQEEHPGLSRRNGHIALQSKPGSKIEFRNIKVASVSNP